MTIVNNNYTHSGLLVTGNGDDLDVELELIGGTTLRMSVAGDELGAWPIDECHIEPLPGRQGAFRLQVDDDDVVFTPTDPIGFHSFVSRLTEPPELSGRFSEASPDVTASDDEDSVPVPDDPVAFLFGSSTPPRPPTIIPTAEEGDAAASPVAEEPLPEYTLVADDTDVFEFGGEPADLGENDDDIVEGGAVEVTAAHAADTPHVDSDTPARDQEFDVEPDEAEDWSVDAEVDAIHDGHPPSGLFEMDDEDPVDEVDIEFSDVDDEVGVRGFLGGSALDRLSAAIGSIAAGRSTDADGGEADDDFSFGPNEVAEEVMASQRSLREMRQKSVARGARLRVAAVIVGVLAVIAIFAYLTPRAIDFVQNYESDIEPPPALPLSDTTLPPVTTTVMEQTTTDGQAPATSPPGGTTIFDVPAPEFVTRWDAFGGTVDGVLEFDAFPIIGPFQERFTSYAAMVGVVQPDGTLDEFSIVIDPTGPAEYDRIGIQALGVAVAVVDPARSPEGRAALLGQLGFNVRQPLLEGIDGSVETGGVRYTLLYDSEAVTLTLTVAAAG
jgi:hypothetical protein